MKNILKKHTGIVAIFSLIILTTSCNPTPKEQAEFGAFFSFLAAFFMMSLLIAPLVISKEKPNPRYSTTGPRVIAIVLLVFSGLGLAFWFPFMLEIVGNAIGNGYEGLAAISLLCYLAPLVLFFVALVSLLKKKTPVAYDEDDYTPPSKNKPDDKEELYDNVADL